MYLVIELKNATACVGVGDELGFLAGAARHLYPGAASPTRLAQCPIDSRK